MALRHSRGQANNTQNNEPCLVPPQSIGIGSKPINELPGWISTTFEAFLTHTFRSWPQILREYLGNHGL